MAGSSPSSPFTAVPGSNPFAATPTPGTTNPFTATPPPAISGTVTGLPPTIGGSFNLAPSAWSNATQQAMAARFYNPKMQAIHAAVDKSGALPAGTTLTQVQWAGLGQNLNDWQNDPTMVAAVQQALAAKGYNVTVDSKLGPATLAALHAVISGITPQTFNHAHATHQATTARAGGTPSDANTGGYVGNTPPAAPTTPTTPAAPPASPGASQPGIDFNGPAWLQQDVQNALQNLQSIQSHVPAAFALSNIAAQVPTDYMVNPQAMANAAANSQFAAPIAELKTGIGQTQAQDKSNLAQLQNWYKAMSRINTGLGGAAIQGDTSAAKADTTAASSLANAMGFDPGSAAAMNLANTGQIGSDAMNAIANLQKGANADTSAALTSGGMHDLANQQNLQANNLAQLRSQLMGLQQERGGVFTTALNQANMQNQQTAQQHVTDLLGMNQAYNNNVNSAFNRAATLAGIDNAAQANYGLNAYDQALTGQVGATTAKDLAQAKDYLSVAGLNWARAGTQPSVTAKNNASAAKYTADVALDSARGREALAQSLYYQSRAAGSNNSVSVIEKGLQTLGQALKNNPGMTPAAQQRYILAFAKSAKIPTSLLPALMASIGYVPAGA